MTENQKVQYAMNQLPNPYSFDGFEFHVPMMIMPEIEIALVAEKRLYPEPNSIPDARMEIFCFMKVKDNFGNLEWEYFKKY